MKGDDEVVTTIRLPDSLHRELKKEAKDKGITFNCHVLNILWAQVKGSSTDDLLVSKSVEEGG